MQMSEMSEGEYSSISIQADNRQSLEHVIVTIHDIIPSVLCSSLIHSRPG